MDLSNNVTQIILAIIAVLAVGLTITIKKINKRKDNSKNLNNVNAGGDIVFGDKKTNNN